MVRLILINGPPRSGKDTFARLMGGDVCVRKFASELKAMTHRAFNVGVPENEAFDNCKDDPRPEFMGLTPRTAYIAMSEAFMKPLLGKRIFGKLLARHMPRHGIVAVTDSGFYDEAAALVEESKPSLVILIHMYREGCEWDSRGPVEGIGANLTYDVFNNGSIDDLRQQALRVLSVAQEVVA